MNHKPTHSILHTAHSGSHHSRLYAFTNGIAHDAQLCEEEVRVQVAWLQSLRSCGYLSADEALEAKTLLLSALDEIKSGTFEWRVEDEDIHMNLERYLTERAGSLGKKIHMGRSRNDLIATTLRLYVSSRCAELIVDLEKFIDIIKALAKKNAHILIPGQTHMQSGQPVLLSHILLGFSAQIERCIRVFRNVSKESLHALPLGAAALAGTTLKLDFEALAKDLGFFLPCENSYDAVGDRDFIILYLDAMALLMTQLSRQCNDFIYWSSTSVGIVDLPKDWSTGSSIMPNKRNPDIPELVRARAARTIGRACAAKTLTHSLCTSYASDLHELKKDCIDCSIDVLHSLSVFVSFFQELTFNEAACEGLLGKGHILATDIANLFTQNVFTDKDFQFRDAYALTARLVELAESKNLQIHDLDLQEIKKDLEGQDLEWLQEKWKTISFRSAVEARCFSGGTASTCVLQKLN